MNKKKKHYNFEFMEVIAFLLKWKNHLFIITILAAVIAAIISSPIFITPKFKSKALFYPSTTNSISSELFYGNKDKAKDPLMFGDEEIDEQYMQLLESGNLKSKIMAQFNLMEHYKIDQNRLDKYAALGNKYASNIKTRRTNYNSIEIEVLDEDPKMAADIANGIMSNVDTVKNEIQGRLAKQVFTIVEEQYNNKLAYVDSLKLRMKILGVRGVYIGIKGIYGSPQSKVEAGQSNSNISENGAEYVALEEELKYEVEHLTDLRLKYEQAKVDMDTKLSHVFVIEYASPAEGKAYPIRSIIIIISCLISFVMACIVLIAIEKYNQYKNNLTV